MYILLRILLLCLSCNDVEMTSVFLRGKGASFPYEVYKSWIAAYRVYRYTYFLTFHSYFTIFIALQIFCFFSKFVIRTNSTNRQPYVNINAHYDSVGSGNGKKAIKANIDIEYAGSDSLLTEAEKTEYQDLVEFPIMAGAIVIAYNFDMNVRLRITKEQLVGIYNGTYNYWNETTFKETNPNSTMPNERILVIARADKSGTTDLFTGALASFSSSWNTSYGKFSKGLNKDTGQPYVWKPGVVTYFGQQNRGVSGLILSFKYSIGYLSVADALEVNIPTALVENGLGNFIAASSTTVQEAMDYFASRSSLLTFPLSNGLDSNAYPIAGFTHFIVYKTQMRRCDSAKEFVRYTHWSLTTSTQKALCEAMGMTPLSMTMANLVIENVLKKIACNGQNVWEKMQEDIANEIKTEYDNSEWVIAVGIATPCLSILVFGLFGFILFQRYKQWKSLNNEEWNIPIEDIVFYYDSSSQKSKLKQIKSIKSFQSGSCLSELSSEDYDEIVSNILQWPGRWKTYHVGLRLLDVKQFKTINNNTKKEIISLSGKIIHGNVVRFFGLTEIEKDHFVIGEYCAKGTLVDVLQDGKLNITHEFKFALTVDVMSGMQFLHAQGVVHGNLTTSACLVDTKWTVKISDWEYNKLFSTLDENLHSILEFRKNVPTDMHEQGLLSRDFWTAPEIIRSDYVAKPTRESDVYSFAIVMQEIYTLEEPYSEHYRVLSIKEIISRVLQNHLRPQTPIDMPMITRQVMEIAWTDNPQCRPTFEQISKMLKQSNQNRKSVIDSVMRSMEEYTDDLEEKIEEKTLELENAKADIERILSNLVPFDYARRLANGHQVEATTYVSVGIIVVEICEDDEMHHELSPSDIVICLNDFCSELDLIQKKYNVFIQNVSGNSLTLIVGVAQVNMSWLNVAFQTAHLCLDIHKCLKDVQKCKEYQLKMRIGADIGPASGGIMGSVMPRFAVFGSVVDVSFALARSAITSSPHITKGLWRTIKEMDIFTSERSGLLTVKGVQHKTYWLTGRSAEYMSVHSENAENDSTIGSNGSTKKLIQQALTSVGDEKPTSEKRKRISFRNRSGDGNDARPYYGKRTSKVHPACHDVILEVDDA